MPGIVILSTAPDIKTAQSIAKSLVKKKLAACVSVREGWLSFYQWKGKVENAKETLLLIKTTKKNFCKVEKAIKAAHPYEVPEIISVPITRGSAEYLSWLNGSVQ